MKNTESLGPCPICGRALIEGPSVDRHHWVPRSAGGEEVAVLHKVCHRMIHRLFDEKSLAAHYADPATPARSSGHPALRRLGTAPAAGVRRLAAQSRPP